MNNLIQVNRLRLDILDEMKKLRKKPDTISNIKRHDLLQRKLEECNMELYGCVQPFNHE